MENKDWWHNTAASVAVCLRARACVCVWVLDEREKKASNVDRHKHSVSGSAHSSRRPENKAHRVVYGAPWSHWKLVFVIGSKAAVAAAAAVIQM